MNAFNSAPEAVDVYYHLRPDIELQPDKGESGFVISQTPLTMLRVNQTLFKILNLLDSPTTFEKILEKYPLVDEHGLKQTLDTLVEKNYVETHEVVKGYLPSITIIIPVKNRAEDTRACLDSLQALDYPKEKLEIIVVDGGSTDDTRTIIESFPVKGIYLNGTKGPSECRNHGAAEANGELLAFIDSDCLASPAWLKELVPYFYNKDVGIVGGYVASFYEKSQVDRYESVGSSLNMGKRTLRGVNDSSTAYVPTCNVLVRKRAFFEA